MNSDTRIEGALRRAVTLATTGGACPETLAKAVDYAVFPGGARVRPKLALAVSIACGDDRPALSDAVAAAIEIIHCASLVHDDLPAFDDADQRRGKPTLHTAFSEPIAVLTGDSMIVLAFEVLARAAAPAPDRLPVLVSALAAATGMPGGICAGQGWESESEIDLSAYHCAKTGSLFRAATTMGAVASGHEPEPWIELGARIGEAFQIADDLRDVLLTSRELGKPVDQDAVHSRPNAVRMLGVDGAVARLNDTLAGAISSIPSCPGEALLCEIVRRQADRLVPATFVRAAE